MIDYIIIGLIIIVIILLIILITKKNNNNDDCSSSKEKIKNARPHINKVPKTSEEKLEYQPKKKKQEGNQEMAEELEDLFEEEYEYDDD